MIKHILISSLLVASSVFGIVNTASAENLVTAIVDADGRAYQVDLDGRSEFYSDSGLRHVRFWLSTKRDSRKYPAIASCAPYDVKSDSYGWDWEPNGRGYAEGTVAGNIARVACNR